MSQPVEYHLSITPKPYELAPTLKDISMEEIKAQTATEENYAEAVAKHVAWKEVKAVAEHEEKSRLDWETWIVKVEALKQRAEEKRKEEEQKAEEK